MNNFIGQFYIEDLAICDDLIQFYKNNPEIINQGIVGSSINARVDIAIKDCQQISSLKINQNILGNYLEQLALCINEYLKMMTVQNCI